MAKISGFQRALGWQNEDLTDKSFVLELAYLDKDGQPELNRLPLLACNNLTACLCQRQSFSVAWKSRCEKYDFAGTKLTEAEPGDKPYKLTCPEFKALLYVVYKDASERLADDLPILSRYASSEPAVLRFENLRMTLQQEDGLINAQPILNSGAMVATQSSLPPLSDIPAQIGNVLERKGQMILYGPPGTGKTYWAEIAAQELAARSWFNKAFDQLSEADRTAIIGTDQQPGKAIRICSFHSAYGYEDFIEGYRPEAMDGQMVFHLRNGIFKRLCEDAAEQPDRNFFLIIDEINRGDIPRIFGELLTILERNKRGKTVLLPLTGAPFRVPPNVLIIGTMNTADRSIALLDAALRRRFGFIELMPDSQILGSVRLGALPLRQWFEALNENVVHHVGRDGRNLQIGHSYLLTGAGRPVSDIASFARVLAEDIIPLLQEYCYEDYTALERILGSALVDPGTQRIRSELFAADRGDELIQALLSHHPDLSAYVMASESEQMEYGDVLNGEDEIDSMEEGDATDIAQLLPAMKMAGA